MRHWTNNNGNATYLATLATAACLASSSMQTALAQDDSPKTPPNRSVPSEYVGKIEAPGASNSILRPTSIHCDRVHGEVYVTDPGNNRVLAFQDDGNFLFEFDGGEQFTSPIDLTVDSAGYIYLLASSPTGHRILKYDFDGLFLTELRHPAFEQAGRLEFGSIALDQEDTLYVIERLQGRLYRFDSAGTPLDPFELKTNLEDDALANVFGSIHIAGHRLYVPVSGFGSVYVFTLSGEFERAIGYKGNNPGQLNFPVGVTVTDSGLVLILDKHRFNVVCFDREGRFLGEFGGKGSSPGWFYHPTLLESDGKDLVYVGQILESKIQICRVPEFIASALTQEHLN